MVWHQRLPENPLRYSYSPINTCVPSPRDLGSPFPLVPPNIFPFKVALFPTCTKTLAKAWGRILVACDVNPNPLQGPESEEHSFPLWVNTSRASLRPQTTVTQPPTPVLCYFNVQEHWPWWIDSRVAQADLWLLHKTNPSRSNGVFLQWVFRRGKFQTLDRKL